MSSDTEKSVTTYVSPGTTEAQELLTYIRNRPDTIPPPPWEEEIKITWCADDQGRDHFEEWIDSCDYYCSLRAIIEEERRNSSLEYYGSLSRQRLLDYQRQITFELGRARDYLQWDDPLNPNDPVRLRNAWEALKIFKRLMQLTCFFELSDYRYEIEVWKGDCEQLIHRLSRDPLEFPEEDNGAEDTLPSFSGTSPRWATHRPTRVN